jgi:MFS family permease
VSWRDRTFAALAGGNYRKFFFGQAVSLSGTWMQSVAIAWVILQLTHSATWLGLAIALQTLPVLLLGPYAGVLVDRLDKRRLLIGTQIAGAIQALALALLTVMGAMSMGWIILLSIGLGIINAFDNPARQAFVREMVSAALVRNAVSLNAVLVNVARAVGPAIAGIVIATAGVGECFAINAASFGAAIIAYSSMDRTKLRPTDPVPRGPGQLREGLRYVRHDHELLIPLLMMVLIGTLTYEFQVVLPAFAFTTFNGGAGSLGLVTAAMGVGAIAGGLVSAGRHSSGIPTMVMASATFGATMLVTSVCPTIEVAAISLIAVGAASIWFLSAGNTALQLAASPEMRGRVMALWTVAFIGSTPIGGPIVGLVAEHAGPRWALVLGAAATFSASALGLGVNRGRTSTATPHP